jgi:hypothetical protein
VSCLLNIVAVICRKHGFLGSKKKEEEQWKMLKFNKIIFIIFSEMATHFINFRPPSKPNLQQPSSVRMKIQDTDSMICQPIKDPKFRILATVQILFPVEQCHGRMARESHGLPKVLLGPAMANHSTPSRRPPLKRPYRHFRGA